MLAEWYRKGGINDVHYDAALETVDETQDEADTDTEEETQDWWHHSEWRTEGASSWTRQPPASQGSPWSASSGWRWR